MPDKQRASEHLIVDALRHSQPYRALVLCIILLQWTMFVLLTFTGILNIKSMDVLNHIIAPLVVAAAVGAFSWLWARMHVQKKIDAAPRKYVQELDKLIQRAINEGEQNALLNARAIVATRNSLRGSLISISSQLNSQIDRLAEDIGEVVTQPAPPSEPRQAPGVLEARRAFETIQVLDRTWPAKREQIEVEIRKLLAELGLDFGKSGLF